MDMTSAIVDALRGVGGDQLLTHDGYPARRNRDGSYSTELSITITDPRMNNGRPTNIPSLWGGVELPQAEAVARALKSGRSYRSFGSIEEAVDAARKRSAAGGAGSFVEQ